MSEISKDFGGTAGTLYLIKRSDIDPWEVWFEDFYMLGDGNSELHALNNAWSNAGDIMALISEARLKVIAAASTVAGTGD